MQGEFKTGGAHTTARAPVRMVRVARCVPRHHRRLTSAFIRGSSRQCRHHSNGQLEPREPPEPGTDAGPSCGL